MGWKKVCAAPGYVLVHPDHEEALVSGIAQAWKSWFPNGAQNSPDIARLANIRAFHRIKKLLDDTKGEILIGGHTDEAEHFVEPTIVKLTSATDPFLREESFGPVMGLLTVSNLDEAIDIVRTICETPLAVYIFSSDKAEQKKRKFARVKH